MLPSREELWNYLNNVATKYDLPPRMTFGVNVESATWIEETARWRICFRHIKSGRLYKHESQFLFAAAGQLVTPNKLDVPGVDSFKGEVMHSARWRDDVVLDDKKVVVFGNGCTAAQIVPSIVDRTAHLTQMVRSKHWVLPPIDKPIPSWVNYFLAYVPGAMKMFRFIIFMIAEKELRGFPLTKAAAKFRARRRRMAEKYMRETAPAKYHDMLIPDFEIGCKRRIFDSGYLESLHSENLTLTNKKAVEIVPNGVKTTDGFVEADVLVLANGFVTNHFLDRLTVTGRDGVTVREHWDKFGGAEAYNCSVMSGFPNFFVLLGTYGHAIELGATGERLTKEYIGPNAATGHTSAIMASENSVNYALRVIKPVLDGKASIADLKPIAEDQYVDKIQSALRKTVWFSGCSSWYVRDEPGSKLWNAMSYPWSQGHFWYRSLFPVWNDWQFQVRN